MLRDTYYCAKLIYGLYKLFYDETDANIASVKHAAADCGAIGQKLLQFFMMHEGFLTPECKKHFGHVFEDGETHTWGETSAMYQEDFGEAIEDVYEISEIAPFPIGSGSIGQVYKLFHKGLNKYVAVKVKHPDVDEQASRFVRNIQRVIRTVEYVRAIPFSLLVNEFLSNIHIQLDYSLEAENTNRMREYFSDEPLVVIPEVFQHSPRFIVMSYHEGRPYTDIQDPILKTRVSCDLYHFVISSLLNYDFMHCDLHYGNWKVIFDESAMHEAISNYQLVIYDCGIIAQTNNYEVSREIVCAVFDGNYLRIADILVPDMDNQRHGKMLRKYVVEVMKTPYTNSSDRFADIVKKALLLGIRLDPIVLRCIQGVITCMNIITFSTNKLTKTLGKQGNRMEVVICYNNELLKRINKFTALQKCMQDWIDNDPDIEKVFLEWLESSFGHHDVYVFMDVITQQLNLC